MENDNNPKDSQKLINDLLAMQWASRPFLLATAIYDPHFPVIIKCDTERSLEEQNEAYLKALQAQYENDGLKINGSTKIIIETKTY